MPMYRTKLHPSIGDLKCTRATDNAVRVKPTKNAETQSDRKLGDCVKWNEQYRLQVQKAEKKYMESLRGLRHELQRRDLHSQERRRLEVELVQKTQHRYRAQVNKLIEDELERELDRQVEMRMETSIIGRQRLKKQFDKERQGHQEQLHRIQDECDTALVRTMTNLNMLR